AWSLTLRHDHRSEITRKCGHGACKYSEYITSRDESFWSYKCEDGRGHPTNPDQACKGVARIECGLCGGLICKPCYNAHSPHSRRHWNQNDIRSVRRRA
ncbi:unnamed protein product, partial [Aureobasidium vineae]